MPPETALPRARRAYATSMHPPPAACPRACVQDRIAESGKLDEATARMYLVQAASAVSHCHAQNVFHRDLKPENILLNADDQVKIADFGLAALAHRRVHEDASFLQHTKCGSLMYAAPEVLTSSAEAGYDAAKADVWSLGIILYSMLSGALPFRMALPSKCPRYAIVHQRGIRILCEANSFTPSSTELLCSMLDPNPSKRITAAEILTSGWVSPVSSPLPGAVVGLTKWCAVNTVEVGPTGDVTASAYGAAADTSPEGEAARAVEAIRAAPNPLAVSSSRGSKRALSAAAAASGKRQATAESGEMSGHSGGAAAAAASSPVRRRDTPDGMVVGVAGFMKEEGEGEEEIPEGVNGMLVRSLGWVQLPEEKEKMVGDVASALDSLGVKYQVVKGEVSHHPRDPLLCARSAGWLAGRGLLAPLASPPCTHSHTLVSLSLSCSSPMWCG